MTKDEALRMALEALESGKPMFDAYWGGSKFDQAITAIKEALAQPEQEPEGNPYDDQRRSMEQAFKEPKQEPVAWMDIDEKGAAYGLRYWHEPENRHEVPLYTAPPQQSAIARTWVGLTDEEIESLYEKTESVNWARSFARAIEAKLKEKNT